MVPLYTNWFAVKQTESKGEEDANNRLRPARCNNPRVRGRARGGIRAADRRCVE